MYETLDRIVESGAFHLRWLHQWPQLFSSWILDGCFPSFVENATPGKRVVSTSNQIKDHKFLVIPEAVMVIERKRKRGAKSASVMVS